jgi:hypothetical protein
VTGVENTAAQAVTLQGLLELSDGDRGRRYSGAGCNNFGRSNERDMKHGKGEINYRHKES